MSHFFGKKNETVPASWPEQGSVFSKWMVVTEKKIRIATFLVGKMEICMNYIVMYI